MYYYAFIDSTTYVCYMLIESEEPITDDPYCIEVDSYDTNYVIRKKYVDGEWLDTVPSEAQNMEARYIGIGEEWLDDKIYSLEDNLNNHTHSEYASSDDLDLLTDIVNTKADANHSHSEYAPISHFHDEYATTSFLDEVSDIVADLSNTVSTNYDESVIGLSVDGQTVTYIKGDGSVHTFVTQDTNTEYSLGTDEVSGLTKLYATTGNAEDGTMTQKAIKTELDKKVGVTVDSSQDILVFTI